jgi:hypothetical protein
MWTRVGSQDWRGARTRPSRRGSDAGRSASRGLGSCLPLAATFRTAARAISPGRAQWCGASASGVHPVVRRSAAARRVGCPGPPHGGYRPFELQGGRPPGAARMPSTPPAESGDADDALLGERPLAALRERRLSDLDGCLRQQPRAPTQRRGAPQPSRRWRARRPRWRASVRARLGPARRETPVAETERPARPRRGSRRGSRARTPIHCPAA